MTIRGLPISSSTPVDAFSNGETPGVSPIRSHSDIVDTLESKLNLAAPRPPRGSLDVIPEGNTERVRASFSNGPLPVMRKPQRPENREPFVLHTQLRKRPSREPSGEDGPSKNSAPPSKLPHLSIRLADNEDPVESSPRRGQFSTREAETTSVESCSTEYDFDFELTASMKNCLPSSLHEEPAVLLAVERLSSLLASPSNHMPNSVEELLTLSVKLNTEIDGSYDLYGIVSTLERFANIEKPKFKLHFRTASKFCSETLAKFPNDPLVHKNRMLVLERIGVVVNKTYSDALMLNHKLFGDRPDYESYADNKAKKDQFIRSVTTDVNCRYMLNYVRNLTVDGGEARADVVHFMLENYEKPSLRDAVMNFAQYLTFEESLLQAILFADYFKLIDDSSREKIDRFLKALEEWANPGIYGAPDSPRHDPTRNSYFETTSPLPVADDDIHMGFAEVFSPQGVPVVPTQLGGTPHTAARGQTTESF